MDLQLMDLKPVRPPDLKPAPPPVPTPDFKLAPVPYPPDPLPVSNLADHAAHFPDQALIATHPLSLYCPAEARHRSA